MLRTKNTGLFVIIFLVCVVVSPVEDEPKERVTAKYKLLFWTFQFIMKFINRVPINSIDLYMNHSLTQLLDHRISIQSIPEHISH